MITIGNVFKIDSITHCFTVTTDSNEETSKVFSWLMDNMGGGYTITYDTNTYLFRRTGNRILWVKYDNSQVLERICNNMQFYFPE